MSANLYFRSAVIIRTRAVLALWFFVKPFTKKWRFFKSISGNTVSKLNTCTKLKVVKWVFINVSQLFFESEGKIRHGCHVTVMNLIWRLICQTCTGKGNEIAYMLRSKKVKKVIANCKYSETLKNKNLPYSIRM